MLSTNIRLLRKKSGLTQIELARKLGVSIATLRRWEAGETAPTGPRIYELAHQLGVMPDSLVKNYRERESIDTADNEPTQLTTTPKKGTMLVFDGGGTRFELPPTDKGYELFNKLVDNYIAYQSTHTQKRKRPLASVTYSR